MSRNSGSSLGLRSAPQWIKRVDETGSVAPSQMSGHQAEGGFAGLCNLVVAPDQGDDFTVHGLVAELAGRPKNRPST